MNGMTFELDTPHGRMMATMLAGIAQFERDLISERVRSGLAAAKARGRRLGRQPGHRPKSDRLAPRVLEAVDGGRSYRLIARDLGISKNTVTAIVSGTGKMPETGGFHTVSIVRKTGCACFPVRLSVVIKKLQWIVTNSFSGRRHSHADEAPGALQHWGAGVPSRVFAA